MEYVIALIAVLLVAAIAIGLRTMRRKGGVVASQPVERQGASR